MYAAVSPAAAQLIQALTTVSSPPALLAPNPRGSHSVAGHSHPQLWAESQQLGLRPEGTHIGSREKSERRKKKRVDTRRQEKEEKVEGEVGGGHLSHSLSYTKVPNVPVIPEAEVGLRAEE